MTGVHVALAAHITLVDLFIRHLLIQSITGLLATLSPTWCMEAVSRSLQRPVLVFVTPRTDGTIQHLAIY
jgi:hypothetical protein